MRRFPKTKGVVLSRVQVAGLSDVVLRMNLVSSVGDNGREEKRLQSLLHSENFPP